MRAPVWNKVVLALSLLGVACVAPATSPQQSAAHPSVEQGGQPSKTRAITIGLSVPVDTIGILSQSAPTGGWIQLTELHSEGLITSEPNSRAPIGRLAERVPSLDDGTIAVLPDGRMRVAFSIRKDVTWQDGTPFTVGDLQFGNDFCCNPGVPNGFQDVTRFMAAVEAPDQSTLVIFFKSPSFQGANLGPHAFWPLPRHILEGPYERFLADRSSDEIFSLPYWTSEYVHLGPFRVSGYEPGQGLTLAAYDRYFLGRPRLDFVHVRFFSDQTTMLSNVLAGAIDLVPAASLVSDVGVEFKRRWDASGDGTVYVRPASLRLLEPQRRPALVGERAILERDVRVALLHALDGEAVSDVMNGGVRLPGYALLAPGDPGYEGTRDSLRRFAYDPERAKAILRDAGWTEGTVLRHSADGRAFRMSLWGSPGREKETATYGSYWRQVGIDVEEFMIAPVRNRDREFRSQYPGWTMTGASPMNVLNDVAASAQNRWRGNLGGFEDPAAQRLVSVYESSLAESGRVQAMAAISEYVVRELPFLPTFFLVQWTGVRKGVKALDDVDGAEGSERLYGGYARNSRLWDLE